VNLGGYLDMLTQVVCAVFKNDSFNFAHVSMIIKIKEKVIFQSCDFFKNLDLNKKRQAEKRDIVY
jgi:hypothetical protein